MINSDCWGVILEIYYNLQRHYRNYKAEVLKHRYYRIYKSQKETIEDIIDNNISYTLFVTTDINAGTKEYEDNFLNNHKHIIVLRRISYGERPDIIYSLTNTDSNKSKFLLLQELNQVFDKHFIEIIVNSLVHVTNIQQILQLICRNKENYPHTKIRYFVHDFHCICLIVNLYVQGHYCALNCDKECCKLYLADRIIPISEWRNMWGLFFKNVDEVRCFSNSSKVVFSIAYPFVTDEVLTVLPHDTSHICFDQIAYDNKAPLHIGVIGNVKPEFKGKKVVADLIKRYGDEIPITLIGNSYKDFKIHRKQVKYLGRYDQRNLPELVKRSHINFVVFPSLCPETFSYVISEIIAMNLPVICFDIGAQGERVSEYEKGIVCQDIKELYTYIDNMKTYYGE